MKKIFLVLLFTLSTTLTGQVREELNYYPLHVGDIWQYKIRYFPETGRDTIFYMTKIVIGDTVLSNGKKYFVVEQPPFTWKRFTIAERIFQRIDSSKGILFRFLSKENIELQTDSLLCQNEGTFKSNGYRVFCSIRTATIFNQQYKTFEVLGEISSNGGQFWKFAMNVGLFRAEKSFANVTAEGNQYDLVYAKINGKEYGTYVSVEDQTTIPTKFSLSQNYPNPFNPETTIEYTIPPSMKGEKVNVTLKIYDVLGSEVAVLVNEFKLPGTYNFRFSIRNYQLSSGVYFYKLQAGKYSETKKMIILQ